MHLHSVQKCVKYVVYCGVSSLYVFEKLCNLITKTVLLFVHIIPVATKKGHYGISRRTALTAQLQALNK